MQPSFANARYRDHSTSFALSPADVVATRRLRDEFAQFWSQTGEDPRAQFDRFIAATPVANGVRFREVTDPSAPGVWSEPAGATPNAVILHLHGGSYTKGSAGAFRGLASQIAVRTRRAVFTLDYPLAPEAPLPAALNMTAATVDRLCTTHDAVGIVGDSAGGGLALAALTHEALPDAIVLFSPWTDLTLSGASMHEPSIHDPLLAHDRLAESARAYLGDEAADDPSASPLFDIPRRLPRLLIQVGTDEILLDDARRYVAAARRTGHDVLLEEYEGLHHVFQLNVADLEASRQALDRAARFLAP